jgi:hypothetical protein
MSSAPPPTSDAPALPTPEAVELTERAVERMWTASRWSRFVAILGFILCGLAAIALVPILFLRSSLAPTILGSIAVVMVAVPSAVASAFVWKYGSRLRSFIAHGEPDGAEAFRSLRLFFVLWTILSAVFSLVSVMSTLRQLLH